jgi:hypothetical protein
MKAIIIWGTDFPSKRAGRAFSPEVVTKLEAIFDRTYNGFPLTDEQRQSVIKYGHPYQVDSA